jgi:L-asparaginase
MQIKIFTTGGSIDKYYSPQESNYVVGDPQADQILREAYASIEYTLESLFKKDSLELSENDRLEILQKVGAAAERHILITHGTDTLITTAMLLRQVTGKVIVLTGAMQPAAFKHSDAAFNVGGALIALQTLPDGVYVVMNGKVFDPARARKNRDQDRFEALDPV